MRILIYGLQSSGATLVSFVLGQKKGSVVVADLFHDALMPSLGRVSPETERIVAKAVVTERYTLDQHAERFRPDKTILVLREPGSNYVSLKRKQYSDWSGKMEEKFRCLEKHFCCRERFDTVVRYEDLILNPKSFFRTIREAGIETSLKHLKIPRSRLEIVKRNAEMSPWCRKNYRTDWGFGNIKSDNIEVKHVLKSVPVKVQERVTSLCPSVTSYYESYTVPLHVRLQSEMRDFIFERGWRRQVRPYLAKAYRRLRENPLLWKGE
jgi:hypothetical protein